MRLPHLRLPAMLKTVYQHYKLHYIMIRIHSDKDINPYLALLDNKDHTTSDISARIVL